MCVLPVNKYCSNKCRISTTQSVYSCVFLSLQNVILLNVKTYFLILTIRFGRTLAACYLLYVPMGFCSVFMDFNSP